MFKLALASIAALTLGVAPAGASTTVGTYGGPNSFPFGNWLNQGGVRFQQVFNATSFNGLTTFDSISLFRDSKNASGTADAATYTISFSTTSRSSTNLSAMFSDNVTSTQTVFGTFTTADIQPTILSFVGNQFSYDPTLGNLLMDVTRDKLIKAGNGYAAYEADYTRAQTARVYGNNGVTGNVDSMAPVVRFDLVNGAAVPEPSTWAMMILGFGVIGYSLRRKTALRFV